MRPEISDKNKYWISKHRHYELKHFCLQYTEWKKKYAAINDILVSSHKLNCIQNKNDITDLTAKYAIKKTIYSEKIKIVEQAAMRTDNELYPYILKGVTEGLSYAYLSSVLDIPCSRDTYYRRYRRFFWILDKLKDDSR